VPDAQHPPRESPDETAFVRRAHGVAECKTKHRSGKMIFQ
jgi:hypothetical protein